MSVQGPSKAELSCKEVKAGLIKVNYKPTEPGVYVIAVKFADNHVKGEWPLHVSPSPPISRLVTVISWGFATAIDNIDRY